MNTKEQVQGVLQPFIEEYEGKHGVWGLAVGAGPKEYNEYGKPRHAEKRDYIDWALHVFTKNEDASDHIPEYYNGVRVMFFYNRD